MTHRRQRDCAGFEFHTIFAFFFFFISFPLPFPFLPLPPPSNYSVVVSPSPSQTHTYTGSQGFGGEKSTGLAELLCFFAFYIATIRYKFCFSRTNNAFDT